MGRLVKNVLRGAAGRRTRGAMDDVGRVPGRSWKTSGIATNIASFLGADHGTRVHELGYEDRAPDAQELEMDRMLAARAHTAMRGGCARHWLVAHLRPGLLCGHGRTHRDLSSVAGRVWRHRTSRTCAARATGSWRRGRGDHDLARGGPARRDLPPQGRPASRTGTSWTRSSRRSRPRAPRGCEITADMYTYTAGSTGLDAAMPPWVQEGGYDAWAERLQDPETRARVVAGDGRSDTDEWENLCLAAGGRGHAPLVGFRNRRPATKLHRARRSPRSPPSAARPQETAIDLVIEDGSRVQVVYFLMSEENVRKQIALPWV